MVRLSLYLRTKVAKRPLMFGPKSIFPYPPLPPPLTTFYPTFRAFEAEIRPRFTSPKFSTSHVPRSICSVVHLDTILRRPRACIGLAAFSVIPGTAYRRKERPRGSRGMNPAAGLKPKRSRRHEDLFRTVDFEWLKGPTWLATTVNLLSIATSFFLQALRCCILVDHSPLPSEGSGSIRQAQQSRVKTAGPPSATASCVPAPSLEIQQVLGAEAWRSWD
jgi:hypothetical protein